MIGWRLLAGCVLLAPALMIGWSGATRAAPDDAALIRAIFPGGPPAVPYTLYPYDGPLARSAVVLARHQAAGGTLVEVAVTSRPTVAGYPDPTGWIGLALVTGREGAWRLAARSDLSAATSFAGTISGASVRVDNPAHGDIGVRYTTMLSGSGAERTSMLRVFRLDGSRLRQVLAVREDHAIGEGACCEVGQSAAVDVLRLDGGTAYAIHLQGYSRQGSRTDTYSMPGALIYTARQGEYQATALLAPGGARYALSLLPVLVALPVTGPAWLGNPAVVDLPGARTVLSAPGSMLAAAALYAGWERDRLTLVVRTGAAWPGGAIPGRFDLYVQQYGSRAATHLVLSGSQAGCKATSGFGPAGFSCTITVESKQAFGSLLQGPRVPRTLGSADHRYLLVGATRIGLAISATVGGGTRRYTLGGATTEHAPGLLSTLVAAAAE